MKILLRSLFLVAVAILLLGVQAQGAVLKILHYTETTGYNHNTKTQSLEMHEDFAFILTMLDTANNSYVVVDDDSGNEFNSLANLQSYFVVIWSNTSGDNGLNQTQRDNFEAYMSTGGNYIGYHAASDTYRHSDCNGGSKGDWDYYAEQVSGASVRQSPNHTSNNKVANITGVNAAMVPVTLFGGFNLFGVAQYAPLPVVWNKQEEYYYWHDNNGNINNGNGGYLSPNFTPFLEVESTGSNGYDIPRMWAQYAQHAGGGCCIYFAGGHDRKNFTGGSMNGSSPDSLFRHMAFSALVTMPCAAPSLSVDPDKIRTDPAAPTSGTNLIFFDEDLSQLHFQNFQEEAVKVVTKIYFNTMDGKTFMEVPVDLSTNQVIQVPNNVPTGVYYVSLEGSARTRKFILR